MPQSSTPCWSSGTLGESSEIGQARLSCWQFLWRCVYPKVSIWTRRLLGGCGKPLHILLDVIKPYHIDCSVKCLSGPLTSHNPTTWGLLFRAAVSAGLAQGSRLPQRAACCHSPQCRVLHAGACALMSLPNHGGSPTNSCRECPHPSGHSLPGNLCVRSFSGWAWDSPSCCLP